MNKIELLGPDLLEENKYTVDLIRSLSYNYNSMVGWHYYLDYPWAINQLDIKPGSTILDAGCGFGTLQFLLLESGFNVIGVDLNIPTVSKSLIKKYKIKKFISEHSRSEKMRRYFKYLKRGVGNWYYKNSRNIQRVKMLKNETIPLGSLEWYELNLVNLRALEEKSIDSIISISVLEHNDHNRFNKIVRELLRVLKPKGKLIVTVQATDRKDWFDDNSMGWSYTLDSLLTLFDLAKDTENNFNEYSSIFNQIQESIQLKSILPYQYYYSKNNAMTWGVWSPKYVPVGVVIEKT